MVAVHQYGRKYDKRNIVNLLNLASKTVNLHLKYIGVHLIYWIALKKVVKYGPRTNKSHKNFSKPLSLLPWWFGREEIHVSRVTLVSCQSVFVRALVFLSVSMPTLHPWYFLKYFTNGFQIWIMYGDQRYHFWCISGDFD